MNRLIRSVSYQRLLTELVKISSLRKLYQPAIIRISCCCRTTKKGAIVLTACLQKHFVRFPTSIADRLNSVQQPAGTARLSGEIVLGGFAA